jgi:hypothetical protein
MYGIFAPLEKLKLGFKFSEFEKIPEFYAMKIREQLAKQRNAQYQYMSNFSLA